MRNLHQLQHAVAVFTAPGEDGKQAMTRSIKYRFFLTT